MPFDIQPDAENEGIILAGLGAHSGRTIMLKDLQMLFTACPSTAGQQDYGRAIIEDNVLLKNTGAARKEAFSRLRRLYSLDNDLLLFRVFRHLWEYGENSQPIITVLYAVARDPILRSTVNLIIETPVGNTLAATDFELVISQEFSGELKLKTMASISRNIASSWTQSGHLSGRSEKTRISISSDPISVTFALFLGYLAGKRGENLYHTPWVNLLDTQNYQLHLHSQSASQQGWLKYKKVGQVTEISFDYLLTTDPYLEDWKNMPPDNPPPPSN